MANPVGRPKVQLTDLPECWQEKLIELGREGASDVEMRVELNISQPLWERLIKEEPQFCVTVKRARELCEAWWTKHGRHMAAGVADGNSAVYIFNMKNRFKWRDKPEEEQHTITIPKLVIQTND